MRTERGPAHTRHVPVMIDRILDLLAPSLERDGSVYLDGTLGMGGHAEGVLERFSGARVIGIDRDREALRLAGERLARFGERFTPVHAVYDEVPLALAEAGAEAADAMLFDLGVSSLQIDEADRGFAYRLDAPLDMRMDQSEGPTAADVLNTWEPAELTRILREYGEERFAPKIARAVVAERDKEPFTTSGRLVELLRRVIPVASQRQSGHPAKRTFQALRIAVNDELQVWERAVEAALDGTAVGGRLAVLSYHSLEDRITKQAMRRVTSSTAPAGLPVELPEHAPAFALVTRGGEAPTQAEVAQNPRAASAHLRVVERVRATTTSHRSTSHASTSHGNTSYRNTPHINTKGSHR